MSCLALDYWDLFSRLLKYRTTLEMVQRLVKGSKRVQESVLQIYASCWYTVAASLLSTAVKSCYSSLDRMPPLWRKEYVHAMTMRQKTPTAAYLPPPGQRQWHHPHTNMGCHRDWVPSAHPPSPFPSHCCHAYHLQVSPYSSCPEPCTICYPQCSLIPSRK